MIYYSAHQPLYEGTIEPTLEAFAKVVAPTMVGYSVAADLRYNAYSAFSRQMLEDYSEKLNEWRNKPRALRERDYDNTVMSSLKSVRENNKETRERSIRYTQMLRAINLWNPPPALEGLKYRMISVLADRQYDTETIPWSIPTYEEWEADHEKMLVTMLMHYQEDWDRHVAAVDKNNAFLEAVKEEFGFTILDAQPDW